VIPGEQEKLHNGKLYTLYPADSNNIVKANKNRASEVSSMNDDNYNFVQSFTGKPQRRPLRRPGRGRMILKLILQKDTVSIESVDSGQDPVKGFCDMMMDLWVP
jgi:hypothetical protein